MREIALAQRPILRRQSTEHESRILSLQTLIDISADFAELFVVDDRADIGRFIERIAEPQRLCLGAQLIEEAVEDVGMQEQP